MNEKEMSAKMMAVINSIAQNANDPVYVKNAAEDFLGDLFCDYLKNGARAMFCMTDKGPAYTLDTEYGSYSVPFVVLNNKIAAALNVSSNPMIEGENEKKKLVYDLDNAAYGTNKLNDIIENEQQHETVINERNEPAVTLNNEYSSSVAAVPYVAYEANDTIGKGAEILTLREEINNDFDEEKADSDIPKVEVSNVTLSSNEYSEHEYAQDNEAEREISTAGDEKMYSSSDTASNVYAFRESFINDNTEDSSEEYDEDYELNEPDIPNAHQEILTEENYGNEMSQLPEINEQEIEDKYTTKNSKNSENEMKPKKSFSWGYNESTAQEKQIPQNSNNNITNKKFAGISEAIDNSVAKPFEFPNDGGELFKHTHNITITMKYNADAIVGRYTVEFWPTWLQTRIGANGQTYAECLVRISDDNGSEMIAITDRRNKEFSYKFQGTRYTFKMVGVWDCGMLKTHVSIDDDSKYRLIDDFKREEPKHLTQNFLDQFESIERGQPRYFIVPLRADNRGEAKIPIIGIVKDGNNKYILARLNDNTCQYRHNNKTREISGHWEKGKFCISII